MSGIGHAGRAAFEWTGRDKPDCAFAKLRSFRRLVLLTLACESIAALGYVQFSSQPGRYATVALGFFACAVFGWRDRFARAALGFALVLELAVVVSVFPDNANHQYLAICLLALLLLVGRARDGCPPADREAAARAPVSRAGGAAALDAADAVAALQAIRWIVVLGIGWAGIMKLWYGHWLGGEFLAYRIATDPGFARFFAPLLPAAEWTRLVALENAVGAGPFRADAPSLVAISNLTWLAELVLPVGLLLARTRALCMWGAILLLVAIQLGAREVFFGGLMVGSLLLFELRRDRLARSFPLVALVYGGWLLRREIAALVGGGGAA